MSQTPTRTDQSFDLRFDRLRDPSDLPREFIAYLSEVRRHLHQHPELGFEEEKTYEYLRELLEAQGFGVVGPLAGTGLYVDVVGGEAGPTVAYRADMDALPTQDAKLTEYASQTEGVAHLCGHDAHSSVAVGTAMLLQQNRERLKGTVRVFFQPNEEGMPGGASSMIEEGVLEGVEAVYAMHVDPSLEVGKYGLLSGPITASTDQFNIRIAAESTGHSARPHDTVDTIWVATEIMSTLYQLIGRVTDARNPSVLTICRVHGGEAYNVIPRKVEFGGTLRTTSIEDRAAIIRHVRRIAGELAAIHSATATVEIHGGSPPVINDTRLVAATERMIRKFCGDGAVFHIPRPSMGAEDFAHYLEHVPGMLLRVGTYSDRSTAYPLHDAHFDIDERALAPTAVLMARILIDHLYARPLST